ncbi:hypothetical protein QE152_g7650 [Popillia japonica]|uniref:Uncharacterized protein n=1 Tax=Popillia japonica TaxID=7064 RepID=A0AAW1MEI4_POPJA
MHAYSVRFQPEATQLGNLEIEKRPILIKKETGTASSVPRLESQTHGIEDGALRHTESFSRDRIKLLVRGVSSEELEKKKWM